MLDVTEVGVEKHVVIGLVVSVEVAHNGEVRRIRDVEIAAVPSEALNAIETAREGLGAVVDAVAVGIDQHHDGVAGGVRLGVAILRSLTDEEPATRVEGHRAGVADEWLASDELDGETG